MKPKFLDLHVHTIESHGVDTANRMLEEAEELGTEIGFCDGVKKENNILSGKGIQPKNKNELKRLLRKHREKYDYIIMHGGKEEINRLAAKDTRVDILAHTTINYRDSGINPAIAKDAQKNEVAIELNLRDIMTTKRTERVNTLRRIKTILKLKRKYKFDIIVVSGAKSRHELRSPRQVHELLKLIGMTQEEIEDATYNVPQRILGNNRERKDPNYMMEGVKVVG